jgi:hypothetical protein
MLKEIVARLVADEERKRFQHAMQEHHYLGASPKIGESLWYVATTRAGEWVAILSFSAAAMKIAARDQWIGWSYRQQYRRLRFLANNTRYCVLPGWNLPNVASRVLALCERRLSRDWIDSFGHPIVLLETFVDERHCGTLYLADNWFYVGQTRGFRRVQGGYSATVHEPKKIFLRTLHPRARESLCQASFDASMEGKKRVLKAEHLRALPQVFVSVSDPRRVAGRRHPLNVVLAIAAGAYLCGARDCKAVSAWAQQLPQSARQGLRCRCVRNDYLVPTEPIIRDVLARVDRKELELALQGWNNHFARSDVSLTLHARSVCFENEPAGTIRLGGHHASIC